MTAIETLLGRRPAAARALHHPAAPARRHRLGDLAPRRALCRGVRLGRDLRGLRGGDRRRVHQELRRQARALLDRRARGRDRGLGVPGAGARTKAPPSCACSTWSPPHAGSASARAWSRSAGCSPAPPATGRIVLWTNSILTSARRIYEAAGYRLIKSEPHRSFGQTSSARPGSSICSCYLRRSRDTARLGAAHRSCQRGAL